MPVSEIIKECRADIGKEIERIFADASLMDIADEENYALIAAGKESVLDFVNPSLILPSRDKPSFLDQPQEDEIDSDSLKQPECPIDLEELFSESSKVLEGEDGQLQDIIRKNSENFDN